MSNKNLKLKRIYLLLLAFFSGLTIMAVELSASRLIAPYFGTSTFVWTNIIGVIMLALAIGYYLGGKLADKFIRLRFLLNFVLIACLFLLIIPFVVKPLVQVVVQGVITFESSAILIFVGSLLTVSFLFIIPIAFLGMVSPFIIKQLSLIDPQVGKDAGLVFSISTIGSLLGTFLPVLIFIPLVGTRKTIIIFTLILLFITLIGLLKNKWHLILFVLILPLLFINMPKIKNVDGAVYETESAYQYILVQDKENFRYLITNEGLGVSSILNKDRVLTGYYYDYYNLVPYLAGNAKQQDVLILGLAGGIISTQLDHFFAQDYDLRIDGVEIDNKIIETAQKYFDLANPSLTVHNLDARNFLNYTDKQYNSIIIDAYSTQLYIPFYLTTKEFFINVKSGLRTDGVVAMNVNATSANAKLLKSITNTMLLVFDNVYLVQEKAGDWNYMVLASKSELDFAKLKNMNNIDELDLIVDNTINRYEKVNYDNDFIYLTDDKAPIEHLTEWMVLEYMFDQL